MNSKKMRRDFLLSLLVCCISNAIIVSPSFALNARERDELEELDPLTRIEQSCNIIAMERLKKETKWSPDKVLAYAFSDPQITKNRVLAKGAAFRVRESWYHLSYDCKTEDDYITLKSFKYTVGKLIPREKWAQHYLVP